MHRWRCCRRTKVPAIAFAKTKRSTVYRHNNGCVRPRPTPQVTAKADAPHEQSSPWPAPDRRRSETPWATRVRQTREAAQLPTRIWKQKKPGTDCPDVTESSGSVSEVRGCFDCPFDELVEIFLFNLGCRIREADVQMRLENNVDFLHVRLSETLDSCFPRGGPSQAELM